MVWAMVEDLVRGEASSICPLSGHVSSLLCSKIRRWQTGLGADTKSDWKNEGFRRESCPTAASALSVEGRRVLDWT